MARPFRRRRGRFLVDIGTEERAMLAELSRQSRELLEAEDPSSDPAVARLFPAAYRDDPLRSLEFETTLGDAPLHGKLEALSTLERTAERTELSEDELLLWMGALNDLRLVLGTRIEIAEETTEDDFPEGDPNRDAFGIYVYLTWLEDRILRVLGEPAVGEAPPSVEEG
jgi:hypothetical protein